MTTGTASAAGAAGQAAAQPSEQVVVSTSPEAPAAADQGARTAAPCNVYNRTVLCWRTKLTVTVIRNRVVTGRLYGTITQTINLKTTSRAFSERISLKTDRIVGNAGGIRAGFSVSCGSGCRARSTGVNGKTLRVGSIIRGKISYSDGVRFGRVHQARTRYVLSPLKPGYVPGPATWRSPIDFRCDDRMRRTSTSRGPKAGCVFPRFTPTLTTMRSLRFIAPNIRTWQRRGAPKVLHRNNFLTAANRRAVCGRATLPPGWRPPAGWPLPATGNNRPSCDEYAFAGTNEGGARRGNGYGWVPLRENNSQGGRIATFFNQQRVLNATSARTRGDAFRVSV
ncbi:NucA/NucB deoxyribonuclease domain-containing protein [Actinomadura fulvescens]|uniref:NucA/NucB deoxyribonuclease domain-containing protein n=1 Tax=Actinomadura fulvescens TaxID=46160 RepID=UPI0031E3439D